MNPDLAKLRRFALAMGLILFSYVVADFSVKPNPSVNLPFVIFEIGKPELIPIGLVLANIWALIQYWYYGPMLAQAPWRHRRRLFDNTKRPESGTYKKLFTYGSPYSSGEWRDDISKSFPRFLNREVAFESSAAKKGDVPSRKLEGNDFWWAATISKRQMFAAWFHDLNFYAPVIVPIVGIGFWMSSMWI